MNPYPHPAKLLPHDGPARMLTEIVEVADEQITCAGRVDVDSPFARAGMCPWFVGLELAAQAAAVLEGVRAGPGGAAVRPRPGYLVRARRVVPGRASLPAGRRLLVRVRRHGGTGALGMYSAEVLLDDEEVLRGSFSTFVETDLPAPGSR